MWEEREWEVISDDISRFLAATPMKIKEARFSWFFMGFFLPSSSWALSSPLISLFFPYCSDPGCCFAIMLLNVVNGVSYSVLGLLRRAHFCSGSCSRCFWALLYLSPATSLFSGTMGLRWKFPFCCFGS